MIATGKTTATRPILSRRTRTEKAPCAHRRHGRRAVQRGGAGAFCPLMGELQCVEVALIGATVVRAVVLVATPISVKWSALLTSNYDLAESPPLSSYRYYGR